MSAGFRVIQVVSQSYMYSFGFPTLTYKYKRGARRKFTPFEITLFGIYHETNAENSKY